MGTISVSLPSDGTTADVADYNSPVNIIVDEINGGLDNDNISASAAIAGTKLATDSVTDTQLDYPRWYHEIARTTLSSAGDTISVTSIPARRHLKIIATILPTGGTNSTTVRFNNDSANNYTIRGSVNGGADSTATSQSFCVSSDVSASYRKLEIEITNIAAQEKIVVAEEGYFSTAGAGTAPSRRESVSKWVNTADQISRVDFINTGTGDYAIGSEVIVLGHD